MPFGRERAPLLARAGALGADRGAADFDLDEEGRIGYEDALRFADSTNEVRLAIKRHGKEAKDRDRSKGIEHLDIV